MNQHSKSGGRANGNSVKEAQRGATRPPTVIAIVLRAGFAAALVAISSCGKPQSQQETQTPTEAIVQTQTPEAENETPETEAISHVSVPHRTAPVQSSTTTGGSQGNPAARQLTDDHLNPQASGQNDHATSPTPAQEEQKHDFSHQLNAEANTFEAVNATTKVPGHMTAIVTGTFTGDRLGDGVSSAGSHLQATQQVIFSFVPDDRYSATYSATVNTLNVAGDTTNDSIHLDFGLSTTSSDGSELMFTLREVVTITEDGAQVSFQQLK